MFPHDHSQLQVYPKLLKLLLLAASSLVGIQCEEFILFLMPSQNRNPNHQLPRFPHRRVLAYDHRLGGAQGCPYGVWAHKQLSSNLSMIP
jgi:hypothetical protein